MRPPVRALRPSPRPSPLLAPLRPGLLLAAALLVAAALPACSLVEAPPQMRGTHVDADQIRELVPGTTTRADVTSLLGSPTARATFDDNTWMYISEVTRPRIGRVQGVENQEVVVLTFDQGGVLRDVKRLGEKDAKPVEMVTRATPSPGSNASFMQQLLGNIGRYSPGGNLGATSNTNTNPSGR